MISLIPGLFRCRIQVGLIGVELPLALDWLRQPGSGYHL